MAMERARRDASIALVPLEICYCYDVPLDESLQPPSCTGPVRYVHCTGVNPPWAGCDTFTFGDRILAVRLQMRDEKGRTAYTWIISAYAPVLSKTDEIDVYLGHFQECLDQGGFTPVQCT